MMEIKMVSATSVMAFLTNAVSHIKSIGNIQIIGPRLGDHGDGYHRLAGIAHLGFHILPFKAGFAYITESYQFFTSGQDNDVVKFFLGVQVAYGLNR